MSFPLIPAALGISFALIWAFIAGMIVREGQLVVRRQREEVDPTRALRCRPAVPRPHVRHLARAAR